MKNTFSKEELEKKALAFFDKNTEVKSVYATSDGNVFLNENRAKMHAGKGNVYTFKSEDTSEDNSKEVKTLNTKDTISAIKLAETVEALAPFAIDERKSVTEAYIKRLEQLTNNHQQ
jgi:hypothetical protein